MANAKLLRYCTVLALICACKCSETCDQPLQQEQAVAAADSAASEAAAVASKRPPGSSLWGLYFDGLQSAKYIDLSHVLKPDVPIWEGFGHPQQFQPAKNPATGEVYRWAAATMSHGPGVEVGLRQLKLLLWALLHVMLPQCWLRLISSTVVVPAETSATHSY
jgi:hypothetical protein